jgi:hypothetical protein
LGPICQAMNINMGDKMVYLTAMISADFTLKIVLKKRQKKILSINNS